MEQIIKCIIEGCTQKGVISNGKEFFPRGYCSRHYSRMRVYGTTDFAKAKYDNRSQHPLYDVYRAIKQRCYNDMDDVIKVAERLYREENPNTNMDTPSYVYEKVEKSKKRKSEANSELSLYDWFVLESANQA